MSLYADIFFNDILHMIKTDKKLPLSIIGNYKQQSEIIDRVL